MTQPLFVPVPGMPDHEAEMIELPNGWWEARCPSVTGGMVATGCCRDEALYRLRGAMAVVVALREQAASRRPIEDEYR